MVRPSARRATAVATVLALAAAGCSGPDTPPPAAPTSSGGVTATAAPPAGPAPVPAARAGVGGRPRPSARPGQIFPADNLWHAHVSPLPVHPRSPA
ncbi:hypothetical protein ACW0Q9_22880, partial [Micromonospora sp. I033]